MTYRVRLDIFEGPLDLLLHLIKKNEVDIYDIPISTITDQYLEYLDLMKGMNLNLAGEFIVMAATLMHIKSRMLLPVPEQTEEGEEGEDPRAELIRKLLEYQRFKEAAEELSTRTLLGRDVFKRGSAVCIEDVDEGGGLVNLSVFDLVEALRDVLKKASKAHPMELTVDRFRVADKIDYIIDLLETKRSETFSALFPKGASRGEIIVTFLALLELARLLLIRVHQTDDGVIRVYRTTVDRSVLTHKEVPWKEKN